jgi:hypothetical protein
MSALSEALRKKYRNRGEALAALGIDGSILAEEGKKMVKLPTIRPCWFLGQVLSPVIGLVVGSR